MKAFEATQAYFNRAADELGLDDNMRQLLMTAKREIRVEVPVEMDSGEINTLIGYRSRAISLHWRPQ